jgi:MYXO-CTERM domain-containing protein
VPTVDIFAAGVAAPLFDAVSFRQSGGYVSVPGGTYTLDVRLDATGITALSGAFTFENNKVYTIFAMGSLAGQNVSAVQITDAVPTPGAAAMLGLGGLMAARRRRSR